jgi:hypothetical protein
MSLLGTVTFAMLCTGWHGMKVLGVFSVAAARGWQDPRPNLRDSALSAVYGREIRYVSLTWGFAECSAVAACRGRTRRVRGAAGAGSGRGQCPDGGPGLVSARERRRAPWFWEITGYHTNVIPGTGALFAMKDMPWDHGLDVTAGGDGLVGHAGGVILREMADRSGLTAALKDALERENRFPEVDRGVAMVSAAVMIALGGESMSGIAVLEHLSLGTANRITASRARRNMGTGRPQTSLVG